MSCATNLTANRNADYKASITFPPLYNFSGAAIRMQVRTSPGAGGAPLLDVTLAPNANGSLFSFVGNRIDLLIQKADLEALPGGSPISAPWVGAYDIIITSASGIENYLFGGDFIVLEGVTR